MLAEKMQGKIVDAKLLKRNWKMLIQMLNLVYFNMAQLENVF